MSSISSINRLKKVREDYGVEIRLQTEHNGYWVNPKLIWIFPDGGREFAESFPRDSTSLRAKMAEVLKKDGITPTKDVDMIDVDIHTVRLPNGDAFQFYTPRARYYGLDLTAITASLPFPYGKG